MDLGAATTILRDTLGDLEAVYLFGSRARGDDLRGSDVDLAVLCAQRLPALVRWELQERVAAALGVDVDLVDLRAASTVMRVQVLRDAVLLLDAQSAHRMFFEASALSDYARLNEERRGILDDIRASGRVHG